MTNKDKVVKVDVFIVDITTSCKLVGRTFNNLDWANLKDDEDIPLHLRKAFDEIKMVEHLLRKNKEQLKREDNE